MTKTPVSVDTERKYLAWQASKWEAWEAFVRNDGSPRDIIEVNRIDQLKPQALSAIATQCQKTNICFYRCQTPATTKHLLALGKQLGLGNPLTNPNANEDNISFITAQASARYIPYSRSALHWHTDGYYHSASDSVGSFIMHCQMPAELGGDNAYFDSDILYILLHSANPQYITALSRADAMTVPASYDGAKRIRDERTNPVFATDQNGCLILRYTQRQQHIKWHDQCLPALQYLDNLLHSNQRFRLTYRLKQDEGVICNNIVHNRSAFKDSAAHKRLIYRLRYTGRVGCPPPIPNF